MAELTEGSLAASLMYEGVCDVDEHSGFNRVRTVYLPHMAPRAAAVERLTRAARDALSYLRSVSSDVSWSHLADDPMLAELSTALMDSEHWKERRPGE